jgi:hypothetical protein
MTIVTPEIYDAAHRGAYPYNIVASVFFIIESTISSMLIVSLFIVIFKKKWSKLKLDLKLMTIAMSFDLGVSILIFFNGITNLFNYGGYLNTDFTCKLNSFLLLFTTATSISIVGVLSLERCLIVVYKKDFSDKFYYSLIIAQFIMNFPSWLVTVLLDGVVLMPSTNYCMFNIRTTGGLIGSIFLFLSCGISDILVFICYPAICFYRRNQSRKAQLELGLDPVKVRREVNRTIYKSMALIVASAISNGPYCVGFVMIWVDSFELTPALDMVQEIFMSLNSIINSLILINLKPELWKSLKELWGFKQDNS